MGIGILSSYLQWRVGTWICSSAANTVFWGIKRRYQGADLQLDKPLPNMLNLTRSKVEEIASLGHLKDQSYLLNIPWVHKGTFRYQSTKDFESAINRIVNVATGLLTVTAITGLLGKMFIVCAKKPEQLG